MASDHPEDTKQFPSESPIGIDFENNSKTERTSAINPSAHNLKRDGATEILDSCEETGEALARRMGLERLIYGISSKFVGVIVRNMDEEINEALASIGTFTATDRAYVFQFRHGRHDADNTHEWCAEGIESQICNLQNIPFETELPWFTERILNDEIFQVSAVSDLPPAAWRERKHFQVQDIQSLIVVPMVSGERIFGFLGFDAVRNLRTWVDDDLLLLRRVADIFVQAIERKSWEQKLKENKERLDLALDATNAGLWDWYVQTGEVLLSPGWAEIIGYTLDELSPVSIETWRNHCHPDDLLKSDEELNKYFNGMIDHYQCELRMRHKNGSWIWVADRGKVVHRDDQGKPCRMVGTHIDITQRKTLEVMTRAERDMAASWSLSGTFKDRLSVCLHSAIHISSMDGGGLYLVNDVDGSLDLVAHEGLSQAFIHRSRHYPAGSENSRLVRNGTPVFTQYRDLAPQRQELIDLEDLKAIAVIPILFRGQAIACLNLGSHSPELMDESTRKALAQIVSFLGGFIMQETLEEKNRQSKQDLESLFNSIQDLVFILDARGHILAYNSAVAAQLGYDADELLGKPVQAVHPRDCLQEVDAVMARMMAGETKSCHIPLLAKNGRLISVETRVQFGHWNNSPAIYGICRDISERLQLERQAQLMEKAESLSRMAGAIAHHFNNLLGVVTGNLELAMDDLPEDREIGSYLTDAFQAARRAVNLSHLMLTYLGQSNKRKALLDLSDTCRNILNSLTKEMKKDALLEVDLPNPGPIISTNETQIHEILKNLLVNASESLHDGKGSIHFSIKPASPAEIPEKRFPADFFPVHSAYSCMEVKDTGCGIVEGNLDKIFDPFFSTRFTGRGLGLAVVLGIVREHNGAVSVETSLAQGSIFRVFLPVCTAKGMGQDEAGFLEKPL